MQAAGTDHKELIQRHSHEIERRLKADGNLKEILGDLSADIRGLFNAERVTVYALPESGAHLFSILKTGLEFSSGNLKIETSADSVAGYVALHRKLLNIADAYDDAALAALDPPARFFRAVDSKSGFRSREILAAPIVGPGGDLRGVLQLLNSRDSRPFPPAAEKLASQYCSTLADAIREWQTPRKWHHDFPYRALRQFAFEERARLQQILEQRPQELPREVMARVAKELKIPEARWRGYAELITVYRAKLPTPCWVVTMPEAQRSREAHFVGLLLGEGKLGYYLLERSSDDAATLCALDADGNRRVLGEAMESSRAAFIAALERQLPKTGVADAPEAREGSSPGSGGTISKENLSREVLQSVLDAAMMDFSAHGERGIVVRECGIQVVVVIPEGRTDYLTMTASWTLKPEIPRSQKLETANRVNEEYLLVRASIDRDNDFCLSTNLVLNAEVSRRYFAMTLKRFALICSGVAQEHLATMAK